MSAVWTPINPLPASTRVTRTRAMAVSVFLHLAVLAVLTAVRFKSADPQAVPESHTASVGISGGSVAAGPAIGPAPRMSLPQPFGQGDSAADYLSPRQVFGDQKPDLVRPVLFSGPSDGGLAAVLPGPAVEFFGSRREFVRKVCYVVDSSGSMHGVFGRVQRNLAESISALAPDQYFSVIFFGADLRQFRDGRLVRATAVAKASALEFIKAVRPGGKTDAIQALERALQIRDEAGDGPSVIYFLTDGFELSEGDTEVFVRKAGRLLGTGRTRVDTIAFGPRPADRKALEAVARSAAGRFVDVLSFKGGDGG